MVEKAARQMDSLLKSLPKDYHYIKTNTVPKSLEMVQGEKADISLVSTDALDLEYEVVLPQGVDTSYFEQNPVVTMAHDYTSMPVGRAAWIKKEKDGIRAKTIYASKPEGWQGDWLPDAIFSLTQQGVIRGKSIGFQPTKIRPPTPEEIKARPDWERASAIIETCILLEYAVAPVPCNPTALVEIVSKGFSKATLKSLGFQVPEAKPVKRQADPHLEILKALKQVDLDKLADEIIDRLKGKV